ncbi:uncharacterized protein LTR77_007130 [Saxophila tyrrhenica]|uniref:Peptidase S26 domain-containing protein n=1 Tax=Saxophila tyrrhenica TaxID=1690608 RepID=A0AAV9P3X5_9PEZI|nr:hypothetical protein LTR77_007130 [Saxophila tyrrhenica]
MFRAGRGLRTLRCNQLFRPTLLQRTRLTSSTPPPPKASNAYPRPTRSQILLDRYARRSTTVVYILLGILLTGHILATYVVEVGWCYGISMLPSFASYGDVVFISKYHRRGRDIHVGDIVSYAHPIEEGERAIKRVLGMPGDFVLRDTPGKGKGVMLQVPKGHCWLGGENLTWSRDSRLFGPVPLALIKGRVTHRVPFGSWPVRLERGLTRADVEEDGVD